MKCPSCQSSISNYVFYCPKCGAQTPLIKEKLSAKLALREGWPAFKSMMPGFYGFAVFFVLLVLAPVFLAAFWLPMLELTGNLFFDYLLHNAALLLLVPLALVPLASGDKFLAGRYTIGDYFGSLTWYIKYLPFVLLNEIYFFVLKYVCTGLPANDPILHLVRLVMVLYWLAIVWPAPLLMARGLCPGKAVLAAWRGGREARWQQFFLLFICAALIAVSAIPLGLGLLVSVPFTIFIFSTYVKRQIEQHVYDGRLPAEGE